MKSKVSLFLAIVLMFGTFSVPVAHATDYSYWGLVNQVTSTNPYEIVKKLASPEFKGRQTGFEGEKITTEYIADYFKTIGLAPAGDNGSYFQQVPMTLICPGSPINFAQLDINGSPTRQFEFKKDYNVLIASGSGNVKSTAVFCGYGLSSKNKVVYDDYAGIDVTGKIAVIFRGGPSFFTSQAATDGQLQSLLNFTTKVANAKAHGATAVILIENPYYPPERRTKLNTRNVTGYQSDLPAVYLAVETGDIVLSETGKTSKDMADNIESQQKPYSFPLTKSQWQVQVTIDIKENVKSPNVVGYIPSSDPFGANDTLLIGAHWDHIGVDASGTLYPGSMDNASGVSVLLEVARVFATNRVKLNKNLAFVAFTGEEEGLLGSAYMANNCPFPTDGLTVINMDMVGGNPNSIGCATDPYFEDLNGKLKQSAIKVGADLNVTGPAGSSSDQYPFYVMGIPSVFIIAADGDVRYHQPEDTPDKVNPEGLQLVAKFITHAASLYTDPFYLALDDQGPVTVGTNEYQITGYTGKNAYVSVGGRNTIASDTGRFSLPIPLNKGSQTIKISATKPGSAYKLEKELSVSYELRSKAVSSLSQVNFGYISKDRTNAISFTITNVGEGPLSGTIKPCNENDWVTITPRQLGDKQTTLTASVNFDKIVEPGFHTCMLEVETNNGRLLIPVTSVSGDTLVSLDMELGNKKATISDTTIPIANPAIAVGENHYVPLSVASMAFGTTLVLEENHATITLGTRKITFWPDTNIALVGNTPIKLKGNVYGNNGDLMIPTDVLDQLGIKTEFDEENAKLHITFDATPFNFTYKPKDLKFSLDPTNPNIADTKLVIGTNRNVPAIISTDADWLYVWPNKGQLGPFPFNLQIRFATARLAKAGVQTAKIKVVTDQGTFEIPVTLIVPTTDKVIKIQIGNTTGYIDGKETTLAQPPFIDGGTTMVPYRFLGEAFGATIEWIAESKTVRATLDRTTVELVIGQTTAKINGVTTKLAKAPKIVGGSTFVPFRFIGEAFKATVDWEQTSKTITVTMNSAGASPKLNVKPKEVELVWNDAVADKTPPVASVEVKNDGQGTIQILETNTFGTNVAPTILKDRVNISAKFNPEGTDESETVFIKTNAGTEAVTAKLGIYPKETSIIRANPDGSWYINGLKQNEVYKRVQDLVACSAMRMTGAASGTSLYDDVNSLLTVSASGHILLLNTQTGDYTLDGVKAPWKFGFKLSETDVSLPLAVYSLAFGWKITETADGTVRMSVPRDKPPYLESNRKSLDLIWDTTPKRMSAFTAPKYPLKTGETYSFEKSTGKYRLYFFFNAGSESENIIPYIESINRRFADKGLDSLLISSGITSDMSIEQFLGGNSRIAYGLSSLSIAGLTTPIAFDPDGKVCSEFGGQAVPRLYIVDSAGNLLFELPDMDVSQLPYLEQAVSAIVTGSTSLPPDIQTISITNKGGSAGEGSLTPTKPSVMVLKPKFKMSPVNVSASFISSVLQDEQNLPAFAKSGLTLLGNSNQQDISVRLWKLPKFAVFTSFSDNSDMVRLGKIWKKMPQVCKAGENPICPVSEIVDLIGGNIRLNADGKYLITAGEKEIIVSVGESKVFIGANGVDLGAPFSVAKGVLYGPAKLLSDVLNAKMYRFDETVCIVAPSLKASATGPVLATDMQTLTFNNYVEPEGGYPPAPDFTLTNYPNSAKKQTSLDDILNRKDVKVLVIDFWATWCPPCKSGMPYMEKMYRDYKDKGLAFYGVITDSDTVDDDYVASVLEDDARIRGGLKKLGLDAITYPMLYENLKAPKAFGAYKGTSIPRVVVITKDKKWAFTKVGFWEIGHRNLEFTVRRLLGIEETSKIPSLNIKNAGVQELKGTVSVDLPYIVPDQTSFSTLDKTSITFKFMTNSVPTIPQRGNITITSNGGNLTIPIAYNSIAAGANTEFEIDTETGETIVNSNKVNIITPSIYEKGNQMLSIDTVMSMIGGQTTILSDKKRAKSIFENWEIVFVGGSKDISVGPITLKANADVVVQDGHVYVDLDTLSYILAMEYDFANGNKTILLRITNE